MRTCVKCNEYSVEIDRSNELSDVQEEIGISFKGYCFFCISEEMMWQIRKKFPFLEQD